MQILQHQALLQHFTFNNNFFPNVPSNILNFNGVLNPVLQQGSQSYQVNMVSSTQPSNGKLSITAGGCVNGSVYALMPIQSAFFKLENNFPFALIHYRGNPGNTTTIYFERGIKREDVVQIVRQIAANLDLPPTDVVWISTS